jgi:hypothetical protein
MGESGVGGFVAECFWPDVTDDGVRAAGERIVACVDALTRTGVTVRYCGSILLREDEVVLCRFEGTAEDVREVVECAEVPFERILVSTTYPARGGSNT